MPIDLATEELLSLTDAANSLPPLDGKRPHVSTIWRWCRKGLKGVRLEHVRLGHRVCTSRDALARFSQRLAETDEQPAERPVSHTTIGRPRTDPERERAVQAAQEDLQKAGI